MVKLSCGYKCLQIILVILNSVVLACGIGLICVGSMAESSMETFGENGEPTIRGMVIAVICMGSIIFLIGFLGFCGACLKSACMLILYGVLLGIVTLGLIAGGVAGLVLRQEVPKLISRNLLSVYSQYDKNEHIKKLIDVMQSKLKCCGFNGTWESDTVPASCLDDQQIQYTTGCEKAFGQFLQENLIVVAISIFVIASIQILCMVFAVCIIRAINNDDEQTA